MQSNSDRLRRWSGRLLLLAVLVWSALIITPVPKAGIAASDRNDLDLYRSVAESVAEGQAYYPVAVQLQRKLNYPLQPASTVRQPTMAYLTAWITPRHITVVLLVINILLWVKALPAMMTEKAAAGVLLACGGFMAFDWDAAYLHDLWAGLLLSLGLAVYSERKWWGTWILAALAVAIREHAIIFAATLGAASLYRRRWREVVAWIALGLIFLVATAVHYWMVAQLVLPGDKVSPGWLWLLGPAAFPNFVVQTTLLQLLPPWLAGPMSILPLFGWALLSDKRPLAVFMAYAAIFCVVGRENNYFWAFLVLPAYLAGLALVPRALYRIWRGKRKMVGADGLEPPTLSV